MSTRVKIILAVGGLILVSLTLYYVLAGPPAEELVVETGGETGEVPARPDFVADDLPAGPDKRGLSAAEVQDPPASLPVAEPPESRGLLTQAVTSDPVLGSPEREPPVVSTPVPRTRLAANEPARVAPPPVAAPRYTDYVVRSGDTMSSIATAWFGDESRWALIARANPRVDPDLIRPGDTLRLPPKNATAATPPPTGAGRNLRTTYIVQSGDTLSHIAKLVYGDGNRWEAIFDANRTAMGGNPNRLSVGMRLVLPE